ncbi:MAG TPA: metallophosphoesterase, partial [Roseiflexaceae bacterium]|nr:metallophosphoesterase [Roseiflexaceae bacterium]
VYLISDLHLGPGRDAATGEWNVLEDFQFDDALNAFLAHLGEAHSEPIELIIAGDFIDYPQILPDLALTSPSNDLGTTEDESVERTLVVLGQRPEVATGHPAVFEALRQFMINGHSITIMIGNHDIDILWPEVWGLIFDAIYPPGAAGELIREPYSRTYGTAEGGRIYVEHGHERDIQNCFGDQMTKPFAYDRQGVKRLKRCWGTLFIDKVYNRLERDRWFIDNVKPISRVIKLGLANDFPFTATALALIAKFFLTSGTSLHVISGGVLSGEVESKSAPIPLEQRNAETVVETIADPELRAALEQRMADPAFQAAFEDEVQQFEEREWRAIAEGAPYQPTLDQAAGEPEAKAVLGEEAEGAFRTAAREVLESDPRIAAVIMGHTHEPIDGLTSPVYLTGNRSGYYHNSGTWTWRLRDRPSGYTWQEIGDPANYVSSFTYLRLDPDAQGAYRVTLRNWRDEWSGPTG